MNTWSCGERKKKLYEELKLAEAELKKADENNALARAKLKKANEELASANNDLNEIKKITATIKK